MLQGYEMRQYPSVKWACTELTYEADEADLDDTAVPSNGFDMIKMVQEMMSSKNRRDRPQSKMFMKLFR